jgi:hypothetical protein
MLVLRRINSRISVIRKTLWGPEEAIIKRQVEFGSETVGRR